MSDVMKAMHRLLNEEWNLLHYDPKDWAHGESVFVKNIRPLTNHIGELHKAIAKLKEHELDEPLDVSGYEIKDFDPMYLNATLTELVALLPSDWAGDEG